MALITSDCDAMRSPSIKCPPITSDCAPLQSPGRLTALDDSIKEDEEDEEESPKAEDAVSPPGEPRLTAAIPMDSPCYSCKLTRVQARLPLSPRRRRSLRRRPGRLRRRRRSRWPSR